MSKSWIDQYTEIFATQWPTGPSKETIEVFVFNTNLTFLYKIDIKDFKKVSTKNKVASTHNSNYHWIRILTTLPTQPPRHLLNRKSLNWSWIISRINRAWLYNGRTIRWPHATGVWKSETAMDWQIGWVGKAVRILIQSWLLLCWVQINFFLLKFLNVNFVHRYQICVENEKPKLMSFKFLKTVL